MNLPKPCTGEHTCPSCSVDSALSNKTSLSQELVFPAPKATLLKFFVLYLMKVHVCRLNLALQVHCHLCKG